MQSSSYLEVPVDDFPVADELDQLILMHRNAHFSGSWEQMLRYYQEEGVGALDEIPIERIEQLSALEKEMGQDLFPQICTEQQQSHVERALEYYERLRKLYALEEPEAEKPKLVTDLILAEEPERPRAEERCLTEGAQIVPLLLETLKQVDLLDPLFPGYGLAFERICSLLSQLKDHRSIVPLFEVLVHTARSPERYFDTEQAAIESLAHLGDPAKQFLLALLQRRPVHHDHLLAAMALCNFSLSEEDRQLIQDLRKEVSSDEPLGQYLAILLGEG
jgi:hypothetical protein